MTEENEKPDNINFTEKIRLAVGLKIITNSFSVLNLSKFSPSHRNENINSYDALKNNEIASSPSPSTTKNYSQNQLKVQFFKSFEKPNETNSQILSMRSIHDSNEEYGERNVLIQTLKKNPKNNRDAKFIYEYIKDFKFFNKFIENNFSNTAPEAILHVCKNISYEAYKKGTIIFQEDDISNDKFYIILSGSINILRQKKENVFIDENKEENNKLVEKINRKKSVLLTNVTPGLSFSSESREFPKKFSLFTPFLNQVISQNPLPSQTTKKSSILTLASKMTKAKKKMPINIGDLVKKNSNEADFDDKMKSFGFVLNNLAQGESFGEKALLGEAMRRTATIVAATDVELLIIKKRNFLAITQKFNLEKEKKRNFLMNILPYLNNIRSINTLENLFYCFKEENLILGFCVTEEDAIDTSEKIYFLVEGRCRVERKFYQLNNNITQVMNCQITEVTNNSIIGEEILFEEQSFYKYTVTVTSNYAYFYYVTKGNVIMKFPKEIRQYLWECFQDKEKLRDKLFEERWHQKEMCDKMMNNNFNVTDTSEFVLLNTQGKMKMVKILKSKEGFGHSIDAGGDQWKVYIEKLRMDTKMKSLKKFIDKKKINISQNELDELDYSGLINILNKAKNSYFVLSNKKNYQKNSSDLAQQRAKGSSFIPYFDFGNSVEDKRKEMKRKMKLRGNTAKTTKFLNLQKVDWAQLLIKKNDRVRERSLRKSEGFSEFKDLFTSKNVVTEPISDYFNTENFNKSYFNRTIEKNYFSNIRNINKKISRFKEKNNSKLDKTTQTFELNQSDIKISKDVSNRKNSENYKFYDYLKQKKKDHERIYSGRSYSKKEISEEKSLFNDYTTENDGFYTVRSAKVETDGLSTVRSLKENTQNIHKESASKNKNYYVNGNIKKKIRMNSAKIIH